ncbi:MAG: GNAT family N-acetyltransferase [Pseudomonadales bacterium]|nr:GNAT family N-acetyltransferase [Pseudomonadales bacterium]
MVENTANTDLPENVHVLPSGNTLDITRPRSSGPLNSEELSYCEAHNIPIGYDSTQLGWVTMQCEDDVYIPSNTSPHELPEGSSSSAAAQSESIEPDLKALIDGKLQDQGNALSNQQIFTKVSEALNESVVKQHAGDAALADAYYLASLSSAMPIYLNDISLPQDESLSYRSWQDEDADIYRHIMSNPSVWTFLPDNMPSQWDETIAKDMIAAANFNKQHAVEAIERQGDIIGQMRLIFDNYTQVRSAELTYILAEENWGKGLMSKILPDYVSRSFASQNLDIIYLWIKQDHGASIKCAERSGFVRDGFAKEKELAEQRQRSGMIRYVMNKQ